MCLRDAALPGGTISNWRFDNGLLLCLAFRPPTLIIRQPLPTRSTAGGFRLLVIWYLGDGNLYR
jgi:hypothetical protein